MQAPTPPLPGRRSRYFPCGSQTASAEADADLASPRRCRPDPPKARRPQSRQGIRGSNPSLRYRLWVGRSEWTLRQPSPQRYPVSVRQRASRTAAHTVTPWPWRPHRYSALWARFGFPDRFTIRQERGHVLILTEAEAHGRLHDSDDLVTVYNNGEVSEGGFVTALRAGCLGICRNP